MKVLNLAIGHKKQEEIIMFKLGHPYDITSYIIEKADKKEIIGISNEKGCLYQHGYFVCHDVRDTHIYRIQVGINLMYKKEPDTKIIEQYDISHEALLEFCIENYEELLVKTTAGRKLLNAEINQIDSREYTELLLIAFGFEKLLKIIVEFDVENGFENSDVTEYRYNTPLEFLVKKVDGGYGITKVDLKAD